jgi:hypothetical protein
MKYVIMEHDDITYISALIMSRSACDILELTYPSFTAKERGVQILYKEVGLI